MCDDRDVLDKISIFLEVTISRTLITSKVRHIIYNKLLENSTVLPWNVRKTAFRFAKTGDGNATGDATDYLVVHKQRQAGYTHTHTNTHSRGGNRLPVSATFHSGQSWPGVPGSRPAARSRSG